MDPLNSGVGGGPLRKPWVVKKTSRPLSKSTQEFSLKARKKKLEKLGGGIVFLPLFSQTALRKKGKQNKTKKIYFPNFSNFFPRLSHLYSGQNDQAQMTLQVVLNLQQST